MALHRRRPGETVAAEQARLRSRRKLTTAPRPRRTKLTSRRRR